uniref:hypothetical protein n=1 Tax=Orrella sp. TaxID=1921583 RepID=UPI004048736C
MSSQHSGVEIGSNKRPFNFLAKCSYSLLLLINISGCSSLPIPTGETKVEFSSPDYQNYLATDLKAIQFSEGDGSLTLSVVQYRLQQKYSIPYVYDGSIRLDYGGKTPINEFRWQEQPPVTLGKEWIIKAPNGSNFRAKPAYFSKRVVVLDLDSVLNVIPIGESLTLTCTWCRPNLSNLKNLQSHIPPMPTINSEVSFSLSQQQLLSMRSRVRAEKALVARDIKERESQERRAAQERESNLRKAAADRKQELARIAREGDGSSDDLLCKKYGFRPNTQAYANCRMQIDVAKREMQQQQAFYQAQQQQIQQAQEAERKRRQSDFLLGMGLRMMGGQSASGAAIDQSVGAPVYQPPPPSSRTYTFPNGRIMTCTSSGSNTNCF